MRNFSRFRQVLSRIMFIGSAMIRESNFASRNGDKTREATSGQLKMILRGCREEKVYLSRRIHLKLVGITIVSSKSAGGNLICHQFIL